MAGSDWAPWRKPPGLCRVERVDLNNREFWRLLVKAPVGKVMQVLATLAIALHARSLAMPAGSADRAQVEACMWIGTSVFLAACLVFLVEASGFNHGLKRADRSLHSAAWWRWHLLSRFAGQVLVALAFSGVVVLGMSALERLF
ncbi:hypothetical protein EQ718_24435 (plasmid) [Paracoccus versutus]|uniref:Uncharacterized protein n=1 Tax=Paracoccus versutus TaxID=34007 RepID=A0AAQ0KLA7_PARVE|nr:hypothetical protein [Paracoccus versutus]KGJ10509.1 hypothetical protein IT40_11415 [Paracoccus versutus]REG44472.1 hypothetical protein ATH84_102323 [Paracoccus versutus]WEJ81941.1 hypothetical protein EQ718_24435 [Paracoccus versutus]